MAPDNRSRESLSRCECRSSRVEQRMRNLWIPGRRAWIVAESYDIAYLAHQLGDRELSARNFLRAIATMAGCQPQKTNSSLATFGVVAACHNLLGLQHLDARRMADAAASFDEAIRLRLELRRLFPKHRENEVYLGGALCNRGHACADTDSDAAIEFYGRSLAVLRQPVRTCECSYWDEQRQSWWCEQLEALGSALNLAWVQLAPHFIDNAMNSLRLRQGQALPDDSPHSPPPETSAGQG